MGAIYRYLLILVACAAILLGIQVPNFVDQYEKRLDAHFLEVANNLRGFQEIADKFYGGSLEALIAKHETSEDRTFKEEARPIRNMYERYLRFKEQKFALETHLPGKIAFLATDGDKKLLNETYSTYSFTVPLNQSAVFAGFLSVAAVILLIELFRATILWLLRLMAGPATRNAGQRRILGR
jgi:Protein of unknown function (DUF2937)